MSQNTVLNVFLIMVTLRHNTICTIFVSKLSTMDILAKQVSLKYLVCYYESMFHKKYVTTKIKKSVDLIVYVKNFRKIGDYNIKQKN